MRIFIFLMFELLATESRALPVDVYPNYLSLALHEKEGISFRVLVSDRQSSVTVLAIHGGRIEEGSDEFAEALAGKDFNLYAFIATKPKSNRSLHVTSSHFDDPRATELVKRSKLVISVHGFKGSERDEICLGGRNELLKAQITASIQKLKSGIHLTEHCLGVEGSNPKNLVNLGPSAGVQLELSHHLRVHLKRDQELNSFLVNAVRTQLR